MGNVWEFLVNGQVPVIQAWMATEQFSDAERAKMDHSMDRLKTLGPNLLGAKIATYSAGNGTRLYRLRIRSSGRNLAAFLCDGPLSPMSELTILQGEVMSAGDVISEGCESQFTARRADLLAHPEWRREYGAARARENGIRNGR